MTLKTQKRIILVVLAIGVVLLAWWIGVFPINRDLNRSDPMMIERYHKGHIYIQDLRYSGGGAMLHSPDCPCFKKRSSR